MSNFTKLIEDINDVHPVEGIQFGIFDPEMIKRGSVVHVTVPEAFDGDEPKPNGVFDARMGVIDRGRRCLSCSYGVELCPGHFGHIELAMPVFYHHFVDYVVDVLRCVCFRCSRLLIDKSDPVIIENAMKLGPNKRIKYLKEMSAKVSKCQAENCSAFKPKFMKVTNKTGKRGDIKGIIAIYAEFSSEAIRDQNIDTKINITPMTCYRIMKGISDQDMTLMGFSPEFSRPEWMICRVVPVLPPCARPSVRNGNQQMADDLTHFYINIVKTNQNLKEKIEENSRAQIEGQHALLQYHFSTMQNNDKAVGPLSTHRSNRPLKGISQRFKEKTGRMRWNIQGKRLNFTARTVASVGVNIGIDEFGVPREIAMNLTYPEIVTERNIDFLYRLVRNGPNRYPGAKSVRKYTTNCFGERTPCTIMLEYVDVMTIKLEPGDVVNRHTLNGDYALFNRQPSLHKMSMMGHRVRVTRNKTFRLNVYATSPYNADFDGDELNMHCSQSMQTTQELKLLASVPYQIISPAKCKPIITIVQDSVAGAYLLSGEETLIDAGDLMNLMINNTNFNGVIPAPATEINGIPYWTGHQLYSLVLPEITIDIKNDQKQSVNVVEGHIQGGRIDDSVLGQLVQPIYNIFNPDVTTHFFNNTQNILTRWMIDSGFSIGFGDVLPSREMIEQIDQIVDEKMETAYEKIRLAQQGLFYPDVSPEIQEGLFEAEMTAVAGGISDAIGNLVKNSFTPDNVFYQSIVSGTKGKWVNAQQVLGIVGQQSIWGSRIQNGFTNRTIPHFAKYDDSPYAHGFCRNSFMKGLSPIELFFHAMGGRVGIVDTAIKTAVSGYITRRLMKSLEDVAVRYDMTVRNANNKIVALTYGDDSFDPTKLEADKIYLITYDDQQMQKQYRFDQKEKKEWLQIMTKDAVNALFAHSDFQALLDAEYDQLVDYRRQLRCDYFPNRKMNDEVQLFAPFRIHRLTRHVIGQFELSGDQISDLDPVYVIEAVDALCDELVKYMREREMSHQLLKMRLKSFLSAKNCIVRKRLTKDCFDFLLQTIKDKVFNAFVAPGEMVGPLAAQSIGEPTTQLTLNSFDYLEKIPTVIDGKAKMATMGEWIDSLMDKNSEAIQMQPDGVTYYLPIDEMTDMKVLSGDEDGYVNWKRVEAVTRHPVVNEDGSSTLLKVTTKSGREITATKAKSFLTWDGEKLAPTRGDALEVGTCLPIAFKGDWNIEEMTELDLRDVFSPKKVIFTDNFNKAAQMMKNATRRCWFSDEIKKLIPYNRSDSFKVGVGKWGELPPGKVMGTRKNTSVLPDKIPLDYDFGYFVGAYLAEGCLTKTQVHISNNDEEFRKNVLKWADRFEIGSHLTVALKNRGKSTDLHFHSTLLSTLMNHYCGKGSYHKRVPDFALNAPLEFIKGLLSAYISGDGTVSRKQQHVMATSASERLVKGMVLLLVRLGIFSKISKTQGKFYHLSMYGANAKKFLQEIKLISGKDRIYKNQSVMYKKGVTRLDKFEISASSLGIEKELFTRDQINKIADHPKISMKDSLKLNYLVDNDVTMDPIVSIEEVEYERPWVYDVTVEDTRNFITETALLIRDTFHFSGIASKSAAVTEGAPRIEELITTSKSMKTPSATIYLKEGYRFNKEKAEELRAALEYTQLQDLVTETQIIYQHDENEVAIDEDIEFMMLTDEFNQILDIDQDTEHSPLVLRIEFDREALLSKNMTMYEIQEAIMRIGAMEEYIQSSVSDDNSSHLVMRLKVATDGDEDDSSIDYVEELKKALLTVTLRGIDGITNVYRMEVDTVIYHPDGSAEVVKEQVLNTDGSNLMDILTFDIVDPVRTTSNNIHEILAIYGIEAVRQKIIDELDEVLSDSRINSRHITLLADNMTYSGHLLALTRYGIPNRSPDTGPIAKASNEEITDMLIKAARFHEEDNMKGTSANVMLGQFVPAGTDAFDLVFDEETFFENYIADYGEGKIAIETEGDPDKVSGMIDNLYNNFDETYDVGDKDFDFDDPIEVDEFSLGKQIDLKPEVKITDAKPAKKRVKKI